MLGGLYKIEEFFKTNITEPINHLYRYDNPLL